MFVVMETPWGAEKRARRAEERRGQELRDLREQVEAIRRVLPRIEARLSRLEAQDRLIDVTPLPTPVPRCRRRKTELD